MSNTSMTDRKALVEQINDTEARLIQLRASRDGQIIEAYQEGASKYRLAKDWGLSENTITRIVTGTRAGKTT